MRLPDVHMRRITNAWEIYHNHRLIRKVLPVEIWPDCDHLWSTGQSYVWRNDRSCRWTRSVRREHGMTNEMIFDDNWTCIAIIGLSSAGSFICNSSTHPFGLSSILDVTSIRAMPSRGLFSLCFLTPHFEVAYLFEMPSSSSFSNRYILSIESKTRTTA